MKVVESYNAATIPELSQQAFARLESLLWAVYEAHCAAMDGHLSLESDPFTLCLNALAGYAYQGNPATLIPEDIELRLDHLYLRHRPDRETKRDYLKLIFEKLFEKMTPKERRGAVRAVLDRWELKPLTRREIKKTILFLLKGFI